MSICYAFFTIWLWLLHIVELNLPRTPVLPSKTLLSLLCALSLVFKTSQSRSDFSPLLFSTPDLTEFLSTILITCSLSAFSSVAQSCLTLCNPRNRSTPGLPVHHQLPEFNQTHVHRVSDAIQPSHPLSSPSPPAPNPSKHQSLFQ